VSVLARLAEALVPAEPPRPDPAPGIAVELAARAHAAALRGDTDAAVRIVDRMLTDPWWQPVVEAAVLRKVARERVR
jgi:hypothetical protein